MATYEITIPDYAYFLIDPLTVLRAFPASVELSSTLAGELLGMMGDELDRQDLPRTFTRWEPRRARYAVGDILAWGLANGRLKTPGPVTFRTS